MKPIAGSRVLPAPSARDDTLADARLADLEALYDKHAAFLWRTIRGLGLSVADAEDLTHETFLVAHDRLQAFEGRSSVRTWLCGIALGLVKNHARKAKVREHAPGAEESGSTSDRSEAADLLQRCLRDLDDDMRLLFVLAEVEQLTAPEISEVLGTKVNTVYARLRIARAQFEAALEKHGGTP